MLVTTAVAYLLWLKDVGEIAIPTRGWEGGEEEDRRGGEEGGDSSIASQGHLLSPWKFTGREYTSGTGEWIFSSGRTTVSTADIYAISFFFVN